jgi:hypothetical protein
MWRRLLVVGLAAAVLLSLIGVWAYRRSDSGMWRSLERVQRRLATPAGFTPLGSEREGTTFCIISCNEARVVTAFHTTEPLDVACDRMLRQAARVSHNAALHDQYFSERPSRRDHACFISGDLDDIGGGSLTALVQRVGAVTSVPDYEPPWIRRAALRTGQGFIVEIRLNSGID